MVLLVPFDDTPLSRTALQRALTFADHTDEEVLVLTVVPTDRGYARERGWVDEGFDPNAVAERLVARARELAPEAAVRLETPRNDSSLASTAMDVARTIREVAHEVGASIVFIGSENAGRVSRPITSVGAPVSSDPEYDVFIVRHADEP
ncbi:universal stress protein [Natronomonas sp. EA1]|uniref:universal stress protein n=1 Tax=Natronomonas sp. EA1 TaxID=3421655 RepID=UPI003EBC1619